MFEDRTVEEMFGLDDIDSVADFYREPNNILADMEHLDLEDTVAVSYVALKRVLEMVRSIDDSLFSQYKTEELKEAILSTGFRAMNITLFGRERYAKILDAKGENEKAKSVRRES